MCRPNSKRETRFFTLEQFAKPVSLRDDRDFTTRDIAREVVPLSFRGLAATGGRRTKSGGLNRLDYDSFVCLAEGCLARRWRLGGRVFFAFGV